MSLSVHPADGPAAGEVRWVEDATGPLLVLTGRIDRETVRRFRLLVPPASWPARADLSAVTTLDVAGLELLVHLARKPARTGSRLELLDVPERLRPAIERAGLSQLLPRPAGS
ncbi:STAS domain-containing protein [Modestobacter sp. VKM Ac-2986]|uniref:STAS domain-containing protein n=1 Tax=Modestobacter sp. VKM Ac-2986 TaxID=3004140 RepID=UPI0022AB6A03|nr:STAS domain-containing protein [Modestobacter sp. VKM Ac-2986]MCZ2830964.1 STAS domain-containing protein [Modestobacter sp. VKM Ac-2986]